MYNNNYTLCIQNFFKDSSLGGLNTVTAIGSSSEPSSGIKVQSSGKYQSHCCWSSKGAAGISIWGDGKLFTYTWTNVQILMQKRELVDGLDVYIKYIELEQCEQSSKSLPTGMMQALIKHCGQHYQISAISYCTVPQETMSDAHTCLLSHISKQ